MFIAIALLGMKRKNMIAYFQQRKRIMANFLTLEKKWAAAKITIRTNSHVDDEQLSFLSIYMRFKCWATSTSVSSSNRLGFSDICSGFPSVTMLSLSTV